MTVTYHPELEQGSDEWHAARCGLLTASEMKLIITPTLKVASNEKEKSHLYELLAQRITRYVEPQYVSDDMLRGKEDEIEARILYSKTYEEVTDCGFVTNDRWGFTLGYSPDGLVGTQGLIECKSRRQKYQIQTIVENMACDGGVTIPLDYVLQCQTGLLVCEDRQWIDLTSYSGGLPMAVMTVYPNRAVQAAIIEAAAGFESRLAAKLQTYQEAIQSPARLIPTERRIIQEMYL